MKMWRKKGEWTSFANCGGDDRFTSESLTEGDYKEVQKLCGECRVRPECIQQALSEEWSAVVVAGVPLPDPQFRPTLRRIYNHFREILPQEFEARGDDI